MCKIFTKEKNKGNLHKIVTFKLGGGAKLHKKFGQKLLAISLCVTMVLLGAPATTFATETEPTKFVTSAYANHWGRSDLRAYLNGVEKINNTLPLDTTNHAQQIANYYESQYSTNEYNLIKPFTYNTNILDHTGTAIAVYSTTDRFWLPSGNLTSGQIISWGQYDVSSDEQYSLCTANNSQRIIPICYVNNNICASTQLRSHHYNYDNSTFAARSDDGVTWYNVASMGAVAATLKIDISTINFASAASGPSITDKNGSMKLTIAGSNLYGTNNLQPLPNYGMYLKTKSSDTFDATSLSLNEKLLTVDYTGGKDNQYIIVHAFKEDTLENGTTSYVAAKKISKTNDNNTAKIDVSGWTDEKNDTITTLDDYEIEIWMENESTDSSLAQATTPVRFYGTTKADSATEKKSKNPRVFAMKNELQCSWGDLSALTPKDYNKVLQGNATNETGLITGHNPTNQKIYFGTDINGAPLQFWIAGRETAANDGEISKTGNIMTLYQAKSVETKAFNATTENYQVEGKSAVTLQLDSNVSFNYTGSPVTYNGTIVFKQNDKDLKEELHWRHQKQGTTAWTDGMPINAGTYDLRCFAIGTNDYERTYSAIVTFIINQANPSYKSPEKPLTAVFGDQLSKLEEQLVAPEGVNGAAIGGSWSFKDNYGKLLDKNTILKEFGEQEYTAVFEPTDSNYQTARIKFKVNVTADTSNWGSEEVRTDGKTQYVNTQGRTSVEMSSGNLDKNSILWLREESYDASAWYGIDLSENAFDLDKGQRFYVQWLSPNDDDYQTYYSQLDDARKAEVEGNKGWIFLIGVENHESKTVQPRKPVKVYVQIGDDWDKKDLQGYYISSEHDEQVKTTFVDNLAYPAGTDTFGIMTLSHFSPYFIYDKLNDKEKAAFDALTDEEKTQLDAAAKELAAQQNEKTDEKSESKSEKNSSGSSAKTGDEIIYFTISGVSLMMTLALGLMLNSKINRRKLDK